MDHFVSTRVIEPVLRTIQRFGPQTAPAARLPIFMYHSISDDPEPGLRGYYRQNTPPSLFREHLALLREEGYSVVDLTTAWTEWQSAEREGVAPPRKLAVLTFDDGYEDFLTSAWPALTKYSFSATVFLPSDFIGQDRCRFKGRACLTWEEVLHLQGKGIEFGSHTVTHPKLWELRASDLTQELQESRRVLEEKLRRSVTTFAHPYAFPGNNKDYVSRFREELRASGYTCGVTTSLGCVRPGDDGLLLKRLPANGADDVRLFRAKLRGAYDWMALPQGIAKRLKSLVGR